MRLTSPFRLLVVAAILLVVFFSRFFPKEENFKLEKSFYAEEQEEHEDILVHRNAIGSIRGVIYLMLGNLAQRATFFRLLHQLASHLPVKYPVKVFFDDLALADDLEAMKRQMEGQLDVEPVLLEFEVPPFVEEEQMKECPAGFTGRLGTVGYRHMCRFYSGEVFRHPVLQEYDYAWRLDPDSLLECPIMEDPFEVMRRNGYKYGYWLYFFDENILTGDTLWRNVKRFIDVARITPKSGFNKLATIVSVPPQYREYHGCHYWNNSEMLYLKFFRSRRYLEFFDFLDRTGGFYEFRWGDALVRTMGVNLFLEEDTIHCFTDIAYSHDGYKNTADCPNFNQTYFSCPNGQCPFCRYLDRRFRGVSVEYVTFIIESILAVAIATLLMEGCFIAICIRRRSHPGRLEILSLGKSHIVWQKRERF